MGINQKGQSYSVFKLLIAAIVAVVILGILLQILGIIKIFPTSDPTTEAASLLQRMADTTSSVHISSQPVQFDSEVSNLNVRAVTSATEGVVQEDQLCIYPGEFEGEGYFSSVDDGSAINYTGNLSSVNVGFKGICDRGSALNETLATLVSDQTLSDAAEKCPCSEETNSGKCCVIVLVKR